MIRLLLVFLLFSFFTHNSSGQSTSIPQVIDTADFVLTKNESPYTIDKSIIVSEGRKLTIEDGVVVNFVTSEKYFDVRGTMVVGKGVTFNMAKDTYIKTENSGKLEVNGTESDSVTFTGTNWDGVWANAQGSLIKYSKILNVGDDQCCDWFVKLMNRSTLENSRISNSRNGAYVSNSSKLLNSKIHNVRRHALEIHSNSTVTGNEIYDNNTSESSNYHVYVHNSTFNSNRIYQTSDTRKNYGVISQGGSTLMYNTIGGSTGKHGSVGIAMRYDIDHTIMYNNIGGYASNVVIHGYKSNLQFTGNTFFGEMETSSGQRNVTIENGQSDIDGYNQWGDSFNNGILSIKINLENNFWGNTSDIPASINDYTDEIERKGIVDYDPSLSAASSQAPISIPGGVTKALLFGSDVILSWDAVTASDLAGYKIYSKVGEVHTLVKDVTDKDSTTYTVVGGDINTKYVITAYDTGADGDNDQVEGTESWYSSEFSALSFSLSVQSDNAITTVGPASTYDKWIIAGYDGDSATYSMSYDRANDWNWSDGSGARARYQYECTTNCNSSARGLVVNYNNWGAHGLLEVNELVTTLKTSKSSGSYNYLGQYNGHSYFRTSWSNYSWSEHRDQANLDGAYLVVINDDNEAAFLSSVSADGWVGYYSEKEGTGYTMPGTWKWVEERDPDTGFDLRIAEAAVTATLTATLDRKYSKDVFISLRTSGSASITDDYTLSTQAITISAGSITGTSILTVVEDNTDEDDRDTVKIEVSASTYAVETVDQKIFIAIEDDDQMPGVTLTASKDTISENGGTSDLTATLSTASGRDVTVGLVMQGTAGSSDFTAGGNVIDVSEVLADSLVANYTFNGNAEDGTSNNNNGTVSGATLTSDRFGEANSAYQFDGVNDYISVPLSGSLQIKEDITISVWVNKESSDNWTDFVVRAPNEYYEMRIDQRDNNTAFEAYGRGAASWDHVGSGNHIDNGEWVMLSFTSTSETDTSGYTTRKEFKFYVNGELRNTSSRIGNRFEMNTSQQLMIGSNQNGDNNNFKGKMDELRIYNKALSGADISTLYSNSSVQKINATISIPKGQTTGKLEIKGVNDQTDETDETIISKIVSTTGASETGDQSATILISDDDSTTVSLSVTSSTVTEGSEDYASVKVSIDKASELPVTVKLKFSGVDSTDFVLKKEATLVTGENVTWLPPSWGSGEPNNSGGTEDYAHLTNNATQYNDLNENNSRRFLIEFPYLTSDAISGFEYKAQYNGHSYYRSNQDNQSGWNGAKASADAVEGAYLLVISSEAELSFVADNVSRDNDWIGFYQDRSSTDYSEPLGGWTWVGSVFNPEISEVVIPAGATEVTVYVFAEDDEVMGEPNETMKLSIDQTTNGVAGTSNEVDITIVDNDIKPDASLAIGTATVKEGDGKYSKVTATLSAATTQPVKVNLSLSGTASSGDYDETPDTVQATTNGLVAYYDFDGDANDESGNSYNGTANNATLTTDRHGNANKAYSFNGNNSYVEVPWNGSVRVQDDITMSAWINIKDKSDDGNYYGSYGRIIRAPNEYYEMNLNWNGGDGTNNRDLYARSGGHGYSVGTNVQEGEWKNVIYTYTSDTLRIYVDGVLSAKEYRSWTWNNSLPSSGSLYIGAWSPNNNTFLGSIDDVRIYNRALTTSEVSTLYSVENAAPVSGSITVPTGQTSSSIYLSAVDDDVYEGTETAKLSISSVDNGQAASSGTSVELSIEDNDGVPSVTLTSNKDFIGESEDFKLAVLTATSTSTAGDTIKVVISTSGTGTKGTDYELSSDTIFILPGSLTGTINVTAKWLAQNEPTEGEENVTLAIASVIGATEDGTQSVTLKITETSCDAVDKELKGNIKEDMTLFELCSPYTIGGSGAKIKAGYTVTLEKNAVLTFTNEEAKLTIEGKLVIKEGATINMSKDSYIFTDKDGELVIEGTASNRVTITGESWEKNTNNSSGPGIELNSTVASSIKYADIINSNVDNWDYMILIRDGSSIENSTISGGRNGISIETGTIKNSKIHSVQRVALYTNGSATITGNEIYDSQLGSDNQPYVELHGEPTFKNNRIYSSTNTTKNFALYIGGNPTVENNTIGGPTGQHGAVGIAITYDRNATIRYNNIGGYQANVAVHGHGSGTQDYTFSNNSFVGNLTGNQRHVVVYDGNNRTTWHTTNIPNYSYGGETVDEESINFENNYWGTTTTSVIDASIQDTDDDETFDVNGEIDYTPYSTSASTSAPIASPSGLTKAVSGSDVILTWDAVTTSDLAGYKIYTKSGDTYTLLQDVTDENLTTYTVSGGNLSTAYVMTSYDDNADGTNDQSEGYESWYSFEFTSLSFTLTVTSSDGLTTIGSASTYDKWLVAGYDGDSATYNDSYNNATNWNYDSYSDARASFDSRCTANCETQVWGLTVQYKHNSNRALVEVNQLVTSLSTSRSSGSYQYLGQHNGHSYFRTSWSDNFANQETQTTSDGAYIVVINDDNELSALQSFSQYGWVGYYSEKKGSGYTMPGIWKWVSEQEPKTGFDIRLPEATSTATITATLDRVYDKDVAITIKNGGSATLNDDFTLSSNIITISAGSTSQTSTFTTVQDVLDENDRDTVRIAVTSSTYAVESQSGSTILISIEDDDALPGVTLTASKDTILENGGTSDLTATLSTVSGRDVSVGVVMEGTAGSSDYTAGGNEVDITTVLSGGLVANYTFNGNADDATSNNNDGTVNGATLTTDRFGEANAAYEFDGVNDNIKVPFSSSLQIEEDITLNVWVKGGGESTDWTAYVLAAPSEYYLMRLDDRSNGSQYEPYGSGASSWDASAGVGAISNDAWTMLTFTSTSSKDENNAITTSKEFRMYVDGELQSTQTRTGNRNSISTSGSLAFGSSSYDNNFLKGIIDDIRIYNKALSAQEISTLYTNLNEQKVNATITISKGSTTGTLELKGTDDATDEPDETIITKILTTTGASETGDQSATIIIGDDDSTSVSLAVSSDPLKEGLDTYATVTATLDKISEKTVSVYLKGSDVDASDYRLSDDKLSIENGGLVAHYTFDGNANDVSGNNNNGTVSGASLVADRFGNANSAYDFAGSPDYIEVPWDNTLEISNNITMSLWIKLPSNEELWKNRTVINGPDGIYQFNAQKRNNGWSFGARAQLINQETWTDDLAAIGTEWNHVVFTQEPDGDNNSKNKIYLNGDLITEENIGRGDRSYNNPDNIFIGTFRTNDSENAFRGELDDIRIYSTTLSSSQIKTLYDKEAEGVIADAITIAPGLTSGEIYVFAEDDAVFDEGDEILKLSADSLVNGYKSSTSSVEVTIKENDIAPSATMTKVKGFDVTEGKQDYVQIEATLDSVTTVDVSVVLKASGDADFADLRISDDPNDTITSSNSSATLVAHYKFDGDVEDQTRYNNDGKVTGASLVADRFGNANSAYDFAGSPDYIEVPWDNTLEISNNITMSLWIKLPSNEELWKNRTVINGPDGIYQFNAQKRNNGWSFGARAQLINQETWTDDLAAIGTEWNHVVFTQEPDGDNNSKNKIYLNGDLITEENIGRGDRSYNNPDNIFIGTFRTNESQNAFRGELDDIRIYDGVLDSADVAELYSKEASESAGINAIKILNGTTSKIFFVFAEDDDVFDEGDESVTLEIDSVINGKLGTSSTIAMNVKDNDYKPTVSVSSSSSSVTEGKLDYSALELRIDAVTTRDVSVYVKRSGTALESDYYISQEIDTVVNTNTFSPKEAEIATYYDFNGNVNDLSGNGNDGTISGASFAKDRFGNDSSAIYFDGVNDYVEIPISKSLQIEDEITMNLWINVEKSGGDNYVIFAQDDYFSLDINDSYNDGVYGDIGEFAWGAKSAGFGDKKGLDCCPVDGYRASQEEWYMITYTLTAEQVEAPPAESGNYDIVYKFRGYYNGELINEEMTYDYWSRQVPQIGTSLFLGMSGPTPSNHFKGRIDDLRIYDGALGDEEIKELYDNNALSQGETETGYQLVIPSGNVTSTVYLYAEDDDVFDEPQETLTLTIDSVVNGEASSVSNSISTSIIDNDVRPDITLSLVSGETLTEGTDSSAVIRATLSVATTKDVSISVGSSGTASATDFEITSEIKDDNNDNNDNSAPSLALHLKLNGDAKDESNNFNNGQVYGADLVQDRFANDSSAYEFSGGPDYISIPWNQSLEISNNITMSFWAKLPDNEEVYKQRAVITSKSGVYIFNVQRRDNNEWEFGARGQLINQETWATVSPGSKWNHFLFTQEPDSSNTNTVNKLYFNGDLVKEEFLNRGDRSYDGDQGDNLHIGTFRVDESWNAFRGQLDDIRIYDGTLSAQQVEELYEFESENVSNTLDFRNLITIPSGSVTTKAYLYAEDDNIFEGDETLSLVVDTTDYGSENSSSDVNILIIDNDNAPEMSLSLSKDYVGESDGFNTAKLTATLTNPVSKQVRIPLVITGSADKLDYSITLDTVIINADDSVGSVVITALADSLVESNEKIIIRAVDVQNASDTIKQVLELIITEDVCDFIETDLKGNVIEDLTLYNLCMPYTITGDLIVANGATLTIQPGVEIEFEGPYSISTIDGAKLMSLGTEKDSVTISGIAWGGIDIKSPGSIIQYTRIIEEGNSSQGDYLLKLTGSHIDKSHIYGGARGIQLNDSSIVSRSKIHDIRNEAIQLYQRSVAYGNTLYDIGTDMNYNAAVQAYDISYFLNNKVYSTLDDPNMIAVAAQSSGIIAGNTIGSDKGIHGKFGIFVREGSNVQVLENRIGGFKTNVVLIGTRPEFKDNTFMGELDSESKHMNVRVASSNLTPENQNYPDYLDNNSYWGWDYGNDRQVVDMQENYWSNVEFTQEISLSVYDYDDRADLIGDIDFSNQLTVPSSDAPISPPRNVVKFAHPNGVEFKWTPNEEADLDGYKVYYGRQNNGTFVNSMEIGNGSSYVLVGGNVNNTYYLTAYDTIADGVDDQVEGHESWFADPAASVEISVSTDNNNIAELAQFNTTTVRVSLSSPSPDDISVDLVTKGTAVKDEDYELSSSSVTIIAGTLSSDVTVTAKADGNDNEEDESIEISVDENSSVNVSSNSGVVINIASNICEFIPNLISGSLEEDLTLYNLCNPYYITGNLVVREGVTLTIEPGVTVVFSPETFMSVNGNLIAEGTEQDSITFTGNYWNKINIQNASGGSSLKYVRITDESSDSYESKLQLRNTTISNSHIYGVNNAIQLNDSSSVEYSKFSDIRGTAISSNNSTIYGNELYNIGSRNSYGTQAVTLHNNSVFRNNIVQYISGGNAAVVVNGSNTIILENIIGDYKGSQGLVGLLVREGDNHTIRNNKIGGFTANLLLIGTKPTFSRNSFVGELNYNTEQEFNVVIGNGNININDSVRYDVNFWGQNYDDEQEVVNLRNNYWENVPSNLVEKSIWDYDDEIDRRGDVNYDNSLLIPDDDTPITPPRGLVITESTLNNYSLNWNANTESDVSGYNLYTGSNLDNKVDIGTSTQTDIQIPDVLNFNVALTAYDSDANGENDMVEGHESLPTKDYTLNTLPRAVDDTLRVPINSSITLDQYPEDQSITAGFEFNNNYQSIGGGLYATPYTIIDQDILVAGDIEFTEDRFGKTNTAAHFAGENFLIVEDTEDSVYLNVDDDFAVSFWFKLDSLSLNRKAVLISKSHDDDFNDYVWEISHTPWSGLEFNYNNDYMGNAQRIYDTEWHHVAITYQKTPVFGTEKFYMYLDGIKVIETNKDYNLTPYNQPLYIGGRKGEKWDALNGSLDDIVMYDKALAEEQVLALYNFESTQNILYNDIDLDGDMLSAQLVDDAANGSLTLDSNGDVILYTPDTDFSGYDQFTYKANDGDNDSEVAKVLISVSTPPTGVDDQYVIDEDSTLTVPAETGILSNDSDSENDPLEVVLVIDEQYHADYNFTNWRLPYEPDNYDNDDFARVNNEGFWEDVGYNEQSRYVVEFNDLRTSIGGTSQLNYLGQWNGHSYFISDNWSNWENANLQAQNDGGYLFIPNSYAENQYVSNISYNATFWIGFYQDLDAPDYEEPSSGWTWVEDGIVSTGTKIYGDITINSNGSFTYVPDANFFGENTFKYFAFDGIQYSDTTEVKITVNSVDDPPIAVRDFYTILEDDTLKAISGFSLSAPETGMVVYYPFDGNVDDNGPNDVKLSVYGNPEPTKDRFGNLNSAFYFDGEKDFMLGDASIFPTDNQSFSISLWFKSEDVGRGNSFARQLFGYGGPSLNLGFDNPALPSSNSFEVSGGQFYQGSGYRFRTKYSYDRNTINDQWHNIILTYSSSDVSDTSATDAGMMKIYFDGEVVVSNNLGDINNETTDKVFTIGANPNQNGDYVYIYPLYKWFKGSIDDLIVYNRVLESDEINSLSSTSFATVLANDIEVDGEDLTASLVENPTNGEVTLFNANGIFVYVPEYNYYGSDEMYYIASDGISLSDTTLIQITILEVDDPPTGNGDTLYVNEDELMVVSAANGVLSNDVDVDGDVLSSELMSDVNKGTLDFYGDGSLTYSPEKDFYGNDSFTYVAKDETNVTDSVNVLIVVSPVNDAPQAFDDEYILESGDSIMIGVDSLGVLSNDTDIDGDSLSSSVVDSVSHGTITLETDGTFKYVTDESDFVGVDVFTYAAADTATSDTASVKITVTSRPIAVADTFEINEDYCMRAGNFAGNQDVGSFIYYTYFVGGVLANDTDIDRDSIYALLVETTSHGALTFYGDGRIDYCPEADFNGTDSFKYVISDGYLLSDTVTVVITILPANDLPIGRDDLYGLVNNSALTIPDSLGILSNDTDVDGDSIFASLLDSTKHGSLVLTDGGGFTYTPDQDYIGTDAFKYNLSDGLFVTDTIFVNLIITSRPVSNDDSYTVGEDSLLVVLSTTGVLSNDVDEDSDDLTATLVETTTKGELLFSSDGSFEYSPERDYYGPDSFTYTTSDGVLVSDTSTATITITAGNDNPTGLPDEYSVDEGGTLSVDNINGVLTNDTDIDSDSLYASEGINPNFGTVTISTDGSFEYVHDGSNSSLDEFKYVVSDTLGGVDTVVVSIVINPVNDEPVISTGQTLSVPENSPEGTLVGTVNVLDENIQSDLSGTFDITTDNLWCVTGDTTTNKSFTGKVEFEKVSGDGEYTINIITSGGKRLENDFSMGGYFTCFDGFDGTPSGSLRLVIENDSIKIKGSSQWGETYEINGLTTSNETLVIEWGNSVGEHGRSTITRDDGIKWSDLTTNGGENIGFDWVISSGNDDNAFAIDNIGIIYVNNSLALDHEVENSRTLSLTANDGVFVSSEESVTINIENVWDMRISSVDKQDSYCDGFAGAIAIEVKDNEGDVTATWSNGLEGLTVSDLSPGSYTVEIKDDVGTITENFEIKSLPIYDGLDICYVTADSIDITKNRIFINEGQNPYNIAKFIIYREGISANVYEKVGEIDVTSGEGSFLDDVDNRVKAYRYKVGILDNCGNLSTQSSIQHVTNHLQASQGIGGEINLSWSGYESSLFVPTYQIYKQTNGGDYELLEEVSSNTLSYTDFNVDPANAYQYFIGFEADVSCVAEGGGIAIEHHDFDDIDNVYIPNSMLEEGATYINPTYGSSYITNTTGLKGKKVIRSSPFFLEAEPQPLTVEPIIINSVDKIYPNPAAQVLYVDLADNAGEIEKLYFVDFSGKVLDNVRFKQTGDKAVIDTESLQSGIYLLDVTTKLGHSRVKVIIQK